jgi:hypothetical protein
MRLLAAALSVALMGALILGSGCAPIQAIGATLRAEDNLNQARHACPFEVTEENVDAPISQVLDEQVPDAAAAVPAAPAGAKSPRYVTQAQYECMLALLYIRKSKELQGFSKFDAATFYAEKAAGLAAASRDHKMEEEKRIIRRQQIRSGQILPQNSQLPPQSN